MGLAYVFALIVGVGILTIQSLIGAKDADGDGHGADKDLHFKGELKLGAGDGAHADSEGAPSSHVHVAADKDADMGLGGLVALFLSVRFWVFASLGFGLSGTLLHYLSSVGAIATFITAATLGTVSGFTAALAFRALKRISSGTAEHAASAVGRVGRVVVPVDSEHQGKIRIDLGGQSVDLIAKTQGERVERGDMVVIEEVDGEVAQVSRAPDEVR